MLLALLAASTQIAQATTPASSASRGGSERVPSQQSTPEPTSIVPTVVIPQSTPVEVPTVVIPLPTAVPTATAKPKPTKTPIPKKKVKKTWIFAHLTSYCPGSAGWIAASGLTVYYGMLANNFYPFGTKVYIPVLRMTGQVQDRFGGSVAWNYFDVWSPVCYGTPTGWFKVAVLG